MIASALILSRSNSARFRTSMTRTLYSFRYRCKSFGNAVLEFGIATRLFCEDSPENVPFTSGRADDFRGDETSCFAGETGLLPNKWLVGVIGVLDGRSIGTTKLRAIEPLALPAMEDGARSVGTLGRPASELRVLSVLSSSSIGGKMLLNSDKALPAEYWGEDGGDEDGEGGPKDDGGTIV
jgi:hypothetical protein